MRGIKNRDKLTKESLITSLLKSESNNAERNYMKHFNKNTNDDNNANDGNNANDDTYDGKIRDKITDVRMMLSRLGNIVADNDRKIIKKELSETENKKNLLDNKKEKNYDHLIELVSTLNKKEKYNHHDRGDLNYHGIRDLENLLEDVNDDNYYKRILVKSSFKENYKYYESRGDKDKELSVKQYLNMINPYLSDIINNRKTNRNNSNQWKTQINLHVNFVYANDT